MPMSNPLLPAVMAHKAVKWNDRLALDIALKQEGSGEDIADILKTHSITAQDLVEIAGDPVFEQRVSQFRSQIHEHGFAFRTKAGVMAEEVLETAFDLIHAPDTLGTVKADLIKSVVKWAGLEPQKDGGAAVTSANVQVNIHLGDGDRPKSGVRYLEGA